MSKKIINLGKVKARTKELRLNDTVIEHKYDDEQEWQSLVDLGEAGSSIDTVSGYSELPVDAKENDVAIVEEEEYLRTENKTTILPIEVKINAEDQEIPNIYSINFKDKFGTLLDNEELKSMGAEQLNVGLDFEYIGLYYMDTSAEMVQAMIGVNHPIRIIQYNDFSGELEQMSFYVEGMSIRDLCTLILDIGDLEEDQWDILLGSHINDSSEDNPSYGWVSFVLSNEPINENSLDFDGVYGTFIFDTEAPKFNDMLGWIYINILDANGETIMDASAPTYSYYDNSDYDPEEVAFAIKYANLALNNIAHGGIFEQSNDIYNPKGLFQNDNGEWVSLEEKMNTPRFVDTYADLPKTSIENGIMAVAQESLYRSEPQLTTKLELYKKYRIASVDGMTDETFNSIIEDLLPGYPLGGDVESIILFGNTDNTLELALFLFRYPYNDSEDLCCVQMVMRMYDYDGEFAQGKNAVCFVELPTDFNAGEMFPNDNDSSEVLEFYPEVNKWYWCNTIETHDGNERSVGGIQDGFPTDLPKELMFYGGEICWNEEIYPVAVESGDASTYDSGSSNNYKNFTSIDMRVFNFEDLANVITTTYPAGFYRYNDNEWKYVDGLTGGKFDNEDVLKALTIEDIGNIKENTEKRHYHDNNHYLDQIQWDAIDKINNQVPQNTQARHTHDNKNYLDQIGYQTINNIGSNTNARHTHNNKEFLDKLSLAYLDSYTDGKLASAITGDINPHSVSTNYITLDIPDIENLTLVSSVTKQESTGREHMMVSFTTELMVDKYYLIVFDGEKYVSLCTKVSGTMDDCQIRVPDVFEVIQRFDGGHTRTCYFQDTLGHDVDVFEMNTTTQNLAIYLNEMIQKKIPFVTELPKDAHFGDMCLYARVNDIDSMDAGKTIYINPEWVNEYQLTTPPEIYWHLADGNNDQFFNFDLDNLSASPGVILNVESEQWAYHMTFNRDIDNNLVYNPSIESSWKKEGNKKIELTETPSSFVIPQMSYVSAFIETPSYIRPILFYHEPKLMIYRYEWVELSAEEQDTEELWQAIDDLRAEVMGATTTANKILEMVGGEE